MARTKGWSTLLRMDCTFMVVLEPTSFVSDSLSVIAVLQARVPACRSPRGWFSPAAIAWVMSQVTLWTGVIAFRTQLFPPSWETYTGAFPVLETGLGVNAEATMTWGLAVWTARKGSLSWFVSPLRLAGIRFTTLIDEDWPSMNKVPNIRASAASARKRSQNPAKDFIRSDLPGRAGDAFHLSTPASKPGSACQAHLPRNRINLDCNTLPTYSA